MPAPASEESKQEWKNLIEEQRQSKLPIKQWCQQRDLSVHVFRYWRDKLFPADLTKSSFRQLTSKRPSSLSLQTQGLHIRIESHCDPVLRTKLLTLLMEVSC